MSSRNAMIFIALFFMVLSISDTHAENIRQIVKKSPRNSSEAKRQIDQQAYQHETQQSQAANLNQAPVGQPAQYSYQYRPFKEVPDHIKQLMYQVYTPQQPYVNPYSFFYNMNSPTTYEDLSSRNSVASKSTGDNVEPSRSSIGDYPTYQHSSPAQTIARVNKISRENGIGYRNDGNIPRYTSGSDNSYFSSQQVTKRSLNHNTPTPSYSKDKREHQDEGHLMPDAIKLLLQYQAQIPYNVLADHIRFHPQKPFVPKPLSENVMERSGSYPNQVFYFNANGKVYDNITEIFKKE